MLKAQASYIHELVEAMLTMARLDAGEDIVLLDVREPIELSLSQIKGAINIPVSQLKQRQDEISRDQPVVLFCRSGIRSVKVIVELQDAAVYVISVQHSQPEFASLCHCHRDYTQQERNQCGECDEPNGDSTT